MSLGEDAFRAVAVTDTFRSLFARSPEQLCGFQDYYDLKLFCKRHTIYKGFIDHATLADAKKREYKRLAAAEAQREEARRQRSLAISVQFQAQRQVWHNKAISAQLAAQLAAQREVKSKSKGKSEGKGAVKGLR